MKHFNGPLDVCKVCHYGIRSLNHVRKCKAKAGTYVIDTLFHCINGKKGGAPKGTKVLPMSDRERLIISGIELLKAEVKHLQSRIRYQRIRLKVERKRSKK